MHRLTAGPPTSDQTPAGSSLADALTRRLRHPLAVALTQAFAYHLPTVALTRRLPHPPDSTHDPGIGELTLHSAHFAYAPETCIAARHPSRLHTVGMGASHTTPKR